MIERVSERERIDLVSNLRGEVEERMLRDLATPPMTGEIVSHRTTPGTALERLAQAPEWPREIIQYARSAEGIRGHAGRARDNEIYYMKYG